MISKECFVYLQLPELHELVTVGKLTWQKSGANSVIGTFVYGKTYLKHPKAFALDPFNLPLEARVFEVTTNEGLHGPIRDASPDSWGRYIIEKNTATSEHDSIGFLLNSAEDRVGALSFGLGKIPPAPVRKFNKTIDLQILIRAAHKLENNRSIDESEKAILMAGTSMGGARPKTTVEDNNQLWLAKFPAYGDKRNFSKIEYATMIMAKACGLNVAAINLIKVGSKDVFLTKRFDRKWDPKGANYLKMHFVSGLTLLNIDEKDRDRWSYVDLADQLRRWIKKPKKDLNELFKRIAFNGLISNSDDHPRNHGFLYMGTSYHLSPVYDLLPFPQTGTTKYLAMNLGQGGRLFTKENLISIGDAFGITSKIAESLFQEVQSVVAKWRIYYSQVGVSPQDMQYLEPAFDWKTIF